MSSLSPLKWFSVKGATITHYCLLSWSLTIAGPLTPNNTPLLLMQHPEELAANLARRDFDIQNSTYHINTQQARYEGWAQTHRWNNDTWKKV